jgi:hypothetical protein
VVDAREEKQHRGRTGHHHRNHHHPPHGEDQAGITRGPHRPFHHHVHVRHPRHLRHRDGARPRSGTEHDPDPGKGHNHDEGCNDDEAIPPQRGFESGRIGARRLGRARHGRRISACIRRRYAAGHSDSRRHKPASCDAHSSRILWLRGFWQSRRHFRPHGTPTLRAVLKSSALPGPSQGCVSARCAPAPDRRPRSSPAAFRGPSRIRSLRTRGPLSSRCRPRRSGTSCRPAGPRQRGCRTRRCAAPRPRAGRGSAGTPLGRDGAPAENRTCRERPARRGARPRNAPYRSYIQPARYKSRRSGRPSFRTGNRGRSCSIRHTCLQSASSCLPCPPP